MASTIELKVPPRAPAPDTVCVREVRAQVVSLGGAIVLALCLVISAVTFMAAQVEGITSSQRLILGIMTAAAWVYLLDCSSECLNVDGDTIRFKSLLARNKSIKIEELEAMLLVEQGFNLEQGMQSIQFKRTGEKPERIVLGPCWQRNKLEKFLHSVELALNDPHLLEEVR